MTYWLIGPAVGNAAMEKQPMQSTGLHTATFAGGCFWCMEKPFEVLSGVSDVVSGYIGGHVKDPKYEQVLAGITGHVEAVQISYDPSIISYNKLLDVYWRQIDPTDAGGSFADRGEQYRSVIFYHDEQQKALALQSKQALDDAGIYPKPLVTEILASKAFYPAEAYHQNYNQKNPIRYKWYRYRSGRDQYLATVWGKEAEMKMDMKVGSNKVDNYKVDNNTQTVAHHTGAAFIKPGKEVLKKSLTRLQYKVTQEDGTEKPFDNAYWNNKRSGIYVDIVSGEPLFSSTDKYKSGTGWPSFTRPIAENVVVEKQDGKLFFVRTEIRSRIADSHLGHVFDDGPAPTGKRYCMNSAALRFIPKEKLQEEGYAQYLKLFSDT